MQKGGCEEDRYLTDNVIIVSRGPGMGGGGTGGVAKFPYIWMGALGNGGEGEVIVVQFGWGPEFAGRTEGRKGKRQEIEANWKSSRNASASPSNTV